MVGLVSATKIHLSGGVLFPVALLCHWEPPRDCGFARDLGQPSRVVRIMAGGHALAHKLALWNERRLIRDLYDCYFLSGRLGVADEQLLEGLSLRRDLDDLPPRTDERSDQGVG